VAETITRIPTPPGDDLHIAHEDLFWSIYRTYFLDKEGGNYYFGPQKDH